MSRDIYIQLLLSFIFFTTTKVSLIMSYSFVISLLLS